MHRTIRTAFAATATAAVVLSAASLSAYADKLEDAADSETTSVTQPQTETIEQSFEQQPESVEQSFEATPLDFVLVNDSYYDIHYVFVSPDTSDSWGEDVLAEDILPAGYEYDVLVDSMDDQCAYDIQVVSALGETLEFWGVDLCSVTEVVVR